MRLTCRGLDIAGLDENLQEIKIFSVFFLFETSGRLISIYVLNELKSSDGSVEGSTKRNNQQTTQIFNIIFPEWKIKGTVRRESGRCARQLRIFWNEQRFPNH